MSERLGSGACGAPLTPSPRCAPRPFAFPWGVLAAVVALSVVCAFLAACVPARRYTRMRITELMRAV